MKQITAKFASNCAETGKRLKKGDVIYYDQATKKAYHPSAKILLDLNREEENTSDGDSIQAEQDAFFDNFSRGL